MGSGKSTIAPIVANVLGYHHLDLDEAVAQRAGMPVAKLFEEEGEAAFRRLEAEALRATAVQERTVVATGGGALASEANLAWALEHGLVVYLRVPAAVLAQRLLHGRTVRPLLLDEDGETLPEPALIEKVERLLARREAFYLRAQVVVEVDEQRVGRTVDAVVRALRRYARREG